MKTPDGTIVGCTGKSPFSTFALAKDAANRRNAKGRAGANNPVEPYHCASCHQYHIGEARAVVHRKVRAYLTKRDRRRTKGDDV